MSQRQRTQGMPAERWPDLFIVPDATSVSQLQAEHLATYVAALEARCNTLWGYIQGYDCSCDPVVRFLASELGITVAHAADAELGPAAD